jgi:hypothetical protein
MLIAKANGASTPDAGFQLLPAQARLKALVAAGGGNEDAGQCRALVASALYTFTR